MRKTNCVLILLFGTAWAGASDIDYEHGKAQMRQLLLDRPLFRFYRNASDKISEMKSTDAPYVWAINQFGGLATGEPIVWMPQEPVEVRAEYVGPSKVAPGFIRIAYTLKVGDQVARPLTFEEGWKCIIFELHNIANDKLMHELRAAAKSGRISREEFTWEGAKLEYEAMTKTVTFFKDAWIPWAKTVGASIEATVWKVEQHPKSYEAWLRGFEETTGRNGYPWKFYGDLYDAIVISHPEAVCDGS